MITKVQRCAILPFVALTQARDQGEGQRDRAIVTSAGVCSLVRLNRYMMLPHFYHRRVESTHMYDITNHVAYTHTHYLSISLKMYVLAPFSAFSRQRVRV